MATAYLTDEERACLVDVLVYHQRAMIGCVYGCACGWSVLGASHAEHVADVFEESMGLRGQGPKEG